MKNGIIGILNYALTKEIEGREFYKAKMDSLSNPELKTIFHTLANMEQGHVEYIKRLIETYENSESLEVDFEESQENIFEKRELEEITGGTVSNMTLDLTVLKMGYMIEDDFMKFYLKAAESVEDKEAKELFLKLAKWEEHHRDTLYEYYKRLSDEYWTNMNFTPLY
ncbi:ferritin family protein [Marinitoga litoralis]|jgi:rubrerythrin|uniref:ferritin family protein n=1 Tax=Marinitoga litoralis TaxID=570855 RepID=UPI001960E00A|nr:ferritin family protein [Marinitoga litoralis]MBM7558379.1 rubrerythrin [Marinitoga litoralis]